MKDAGWIDRFIRHLEYERRLSPLTCKNYRRDLEKLCAWCDTSGIGQWSELDSEHVRAYSASCYRKGLSARSIQRRLSASRTFFRYLIREKPSRKTPLRRCRPPRAGNVCPATSMPTGWRDCSTFQGEGAIVDRDRAILELLYSSGLRLAELVDLNLGDVDMHDATVRVTGKGNKDRIVPVGRQALKALRQWGITRGDLADADEKALFVSNRGTRISPRSVQARVKHWAKQQGLDANVYPHLFRHSFATHVLESSHDLRGVQELLGHANISTTQVYTHLDFQHLAQIYDQTHPRARKKD